MRGKARRLRHRQRAPLPSFCILQPILDRRHQLEIEKQSDLHPFADLLLVLILMLVALNLAEFSTLDRYLLLSLITRSFHLNEQRSCID